MASATQHSRRLAPAVETPTVETSPTPTRVAAGRGSQSLRRILVVLDAAAVVAAWSIALVLPDGLDRPPGPAGIPNLILAVIVATGASLAMIASQRLYLARVCSVRAVETVRLGRTAVITALLLQAGERRLGIHLSLNEVIGGAALCFAFLTASRDGYRAWLKAHRRAGRHSRPIVIVGANEEGFDLYRLVGNHPELGFRVCGIVGSPSEVADRGYDVPWLGDINHVVDAVRLAGANGVLVAASSLPSAQLNRVVRDLLVAGVHVHLSSGIRGIDVRRMRAQPMAHEPLFYLEPVSLARWQVVTKRALDLVLSGFGLLLAAPVLAACALAIKLSDKGPVFFRQQRVGQDGKPFTILKLRTMVVDAEERLADLVEKNQRDGVLFKLSDDPRVDEDRQAPAGHQPRRAAPADQRGPGRHEPRRPPAGAADRGRPVRRGAAGPPAGPPRDHRPVAGRGPRQRLVPGLPAARPLLRGELVGQPRPGHPPLDRPDRGRPGHPGLPQAHRSGGRQRLGLLAA